MTSDIQTAVTCTLCWEIFATEIRDPLILPKCGHTFCRQCLRKLKSKGAWHCPLCRYTYTGTSVSELPVNFIALSVISVLKEKRSDGKIQAESKGSDHFTSSLNGKQTPSGNSAARPSPSRSRYRKPLLLKRIEAKERLQFSSIFKFDVSFEEQRLKERTKTNSSSIVKKSAFTSPNTGRFSFFAQDDTSGSAPPSASASALSFRFGQTKSALGSVSQAHCVWDKVASARPVSSVSKNTFDQPPFFEPSINRPTVSSGQSNGESIWQPKYLSEGFMIASGFSSLAPKADPRDRSQDPKLLECNESFNSPSRSLLNDVNINTVLNKMKLLTISKTSTTESSGMQNLSSEMVLKQNRSSPVETPNDDTFSKASTPEESFNFFRISHLDLSLTNVSTLQILRNEIHYHQKILCKEFGLNASASARSTSTNSPSLETSAPRPTSTPSDSSSKTEAANNLIPFTDPKNCYSLKFNPMIRNNANAHSSRFTPMDQRMAILTTFQKLNSETGYYEIITSKGFLGSKPSVHRVRKTSRIQHNKKKINWKRQEKYQESKCSSPHSTSSSPRLGAQKNLDLQCQSISTFFRGLGARPKDFHA